MILRIFELTTRKGKYMDNFVVSARKYRPSTFNTVVGQHAITSTLKNAIKSNHLAQAFLFTGPRGVGKTTCARILAKTINCKNLTPELEACDTCESCQAFNKSSSFNIYELDAASNNGVEHIKSLIDQVRIPPQDGKFKVYIIDEVHMLSQAAFNAFLKTLEEPPAYAKFILATTEKHKILPTILSRCQIYDFKRITVEDIVNHLLWVASSEGITVEQEALHVIARKADGAMRDSLSIFDQLVTYAGNNLTYHKVIENLNVLDYEYYFRVVDAILVGDTSSVLLLFDEVISNGFDGQHFIVGLGDHLRQLLISSDTATLKLMEVANAVKQQFANQSARCDLRFLLRSLDIANQADISYRNSNNKRLHIEVALLKMIQEAGGIPSGLQPRQAVAVPPSQPTISNTPANTASGQSTPPAAQQPSAKPPQTASPTNAQPALNQSGAIPQATAAQPQAARPTPSYKGPTGRSAPSLKSMGASTSEEDNSDSEPEPARLLNEPVTAEKLIVSWQNYISQIDNKKNISLYTALSASLPQLSENNAITHVVENPILLEAINEVRSEFLGFLKETLRNSYLTLNIKIQPKEETKVKAWTPQEKYSRMMEINPVLNELRIAFDADVEG